MTQNYPKARNLVVTSSFLYFLIKFSSLDFEVKIPFISINILKSNETLLIIVLLLCYFLFRIVIEWFSAEKGKRKRAVNRVDFGATLLLGLLPIFLTIFNTTKGSVSYPDAIITIIILVLLGEVVAATTDVQLTSFRFIRSKQEAAYKVLPRVPIAVKCLFPFTIINLVIIYLSHKYAPVYASEPFNKSWLYVFFLPAIVHIPNIIFTAFDTKSESFKKLKECFELHDSNYMQTRGKCCEVSALFEAAKSGDIEKVKDELENGANPDEQNARGWTPFMISVANGHIHSARLLIDYGADVNHRNYSGRTALMFASNYGFTDIVKLLCQSGALVKEQNNKESKSPLMAASEKGHVEIVKLLLEAGAEPTQKDNDEQSALDYAEKNKHGEICKILRKIQKHTNYLLV